MMPYAELILAYLVGGVVFAVLATFTIHATDREPSEPAIALLALFWPVGSAYLLLGLVAHLTNLLVRKFTK